MYNFDAIRTLADIPRHQGRERPNAIAQIFEGRETSYAQFDTRTSQIANGLIALGAKPQTRIGYIGKNSDRYFELAFGTFKANTVIVGVNWRLAPPEIVYVLGNADCEVLFVGAEYCDVVEKIRAELPRLRHVIAMDGGHASWPDFDAWRDSQKPSDPKVPASADDTAIQLYTSGTTGHPKGVELTNANYLSFFRAGSAASWADFGAGEVNLVAMPVFHVAGVNMGVTGLAQGCTSVILKDVDPGLILKLIPQYKINNLFLVPAVILFLTQIPTVRQTDFSSVKRMFYGASPIAEELLKTARDIFGCDFFQLYGLTETVGAGTALQPEDHDPARNKLRSCGKPYPGLDVRIVDAAGKDMPQGEVGEIVIRGGVVMKGYWKNPEATKKAIVDGWFYTGDAGFKDKEGFVFIHDRVKDMIVSGGENVYPAEVENALFGHAAIADVAVIGVPDEKWGEAVKAIVVLKPGAKVEAAEIIAYAKTRIAGYKVPKSVDFAQALPRNPSGKILRRELREPYWAGRARRVN